MAAYPLQGKIMKHYRHPVLCQLYIHFDSIAFSDRPFKGLHGIFRGIGYTFSMAAQIVTPILSGFLLENVSYKTLFPYALVFSLAAFLTMTQVRHGDVRPEKKAFMEFSGASELLSCRPLCA